jgi:hypothetical protein
MLLYNTAVILPPSREGDLKVWFTVLFTELGSWWKPVRRVHSKKTI